MSLKVSYRTILVFFLAFFCFFPDSYASQITKNIEYFFIAISAIAIFRHLPLLVKYRANPIISLCILYFLFMWSISAIRGLDYANTSYFILIILFFITYVYLDFSLRSSLGTCVNAIWLAFLVLVIWDLVGIIIYPDGIPSLTTSYTPQFLFGNKNNHTIYILILLLTAAWRCKNEGKWSRATLAISFILSLGITLLLQSVTSTVSVLVALVGCLLFLFNKKAKSINALFVLLVGLIFNILVITGETFFLQPIVQQFGKNLTFTQRTSIWKRAFILIPQHIWTGWGKIGSDQSVKLLGNVNAHNQILDCLFDGGIVLLAIFVITFVIIARCINHMEADNTLIISIFFLLALIIKMTFEQIADSYIAWFLFLLLYDFSYLSNNENRYQILEYEN